MNLDMRYDPELFRLYDFIVRVITFDRRVCGPNSSFTYITVTAPHGNAALAGDERTPRMGVTRLVREITTDRHWLFLPFGVFGAADVRCADGATIARRPPRERKDAGWTGRARADDCAGFIVGLDHDELVVRPAFTSWTGGDACRSSSPTTWAASNGPSRPSSRVSRRAGSAAAGPSLPRRAPPHLKNSFMSGASRVVGGEGRQMPGGFDRVQQRVVVVAAADR